jgi:hypothetical protein
MIATFLISPPWSVGGDYGTNPGTVRGAAPCG